MSITLTHSGIEIAEFNEAAFYNLWLQQINLALQYHDNAIGRQQATYHIVGVENKTYTLEMNSRYGYTIESISYKTDSGTATIAVQIGGSNVGALGSLSATSTMQTTSATTDKTVAIGDDVTLVVSGISGASDLTININWNRISTGS